MDAVKALCSKEAVVDAPQQGRRHAIISGSAKRTRGRCEILSQQAQKWMPGAKDGDTSLIVASASGYSDMVKFLVSKEADINAKNNRQKTRPYQSHPKRS